MTPFLRKLRHAVYTLYLNIRFKMLSRIRKNIQVLPSEDTVNYILKHKCSVSRYGDGEIDMIIQFITNNKSRVNDTFQVYDENLAKRLFYILSAKKYDNHKHIVCIPYWFHDKIELYKPEVRYFCKKYFCKNYQQINSILNKQRQYYNANMSRFYLSYIDKSGCEEYVQLLRKIWDGKTICFVEGVYSRLGVGNDLFSNAFNIKRILCPARNAFEYYDKIKSTVLNFVPKDVLILIALGHTATVLAFDLSNEGYQAIDLGHIDVEYEWMRMKATYKVPVKNKYVNEAAGGRICSECTDENYKSQVLIIIL